jgi:hypothetical protein
MAERASIVAVLVHALRSSSFALAPEGTFGPGAVPFRLPGSRREIG